MITPEANINSVHLAVQVEEKPILRHTIKNKTPVVNLECSFVHHTMREGDKIPVFDRIRITCFGQLAVDVAMALTVGDTVLASGTICRQKSTERDSQGDRFYYIEAESITKIGALRNDARQPSKTATISVRPKHF
jgi:single-stranded DNA-binding protein